MTEVDTGENLTFFYLTLPKNSIIERYCLTRNSHKPASKHSARRARIEATLRGIKLSFASSLDLELERSNSDSIERSHLGGGRTR